MDKKEKKIKISDNSDEDKPKVTEDSKKSSKKIVINSEDSSDEPVQLDKSTDINGSEAEPTPKEVDPELAIDSAEEVVKNSEVEESATGEEEGNGEEDLVSEDDEKTDSDVVSTEKTEPEADIEQVETDTNITIEEAMEKAEFSDNSEGIKSDSDIDEAIDDIVRGESDLAIAEDDAKIAKLSESNERKSLKQKIKHLLVLWWTNKKARYSTLGAFFVLLVALILIPGTRYGILNIAGVRVKTSMTVIDSKTRLPLKNINVAIQGESAVTNSDGYIQFNELKLGSSELAITKRGYADNKRDIVLGWGSNPIGDQEIIATGEQFVFVLSDWKSNKPITNAEASSGENSAQSDDSGKITLTIGEDNLSEVEVSIVAEGYREERIKSEDLLDGNMEIKMVPGKKHVFVSNRNGVYDLYKIDVDKQNEEILLPATEKEREVPVVVQHPTKDVLGFVSSREGEENSGGFILEGLYIVDAITAETERIARSEQLEVIGWSGDNIIFWQVVEGTSRGNSERSKLISYNHVTKERIDLAAANYFNDIQLVNNLVYYSVSSFAVSTNQAKLFSVDVLGKNKEKIIDSQVWNIYRTNYDKLLFSAENQKWYELTIGSAPEETGQQPAPNNLRFVDSPDGSRSTWIEIRDGKGVLLTTQTDTINETQVYSSPGLNNVLYWSDSSTVVYRVISNSETADYVLNLDSGKPEKISDVTASSNRYY